jgi:ABC-2 type transport system permease protein
VLGSGGAAGVAGLAMVVLWAANGLDVGGPLLALSPFRWMNGHIPLVGLYDWPGVVATVAVGVTLHVAGVVLFIRRDLGVVSGVALPGLPKAILGVAGPLSRAFGDQLPRAIAWGLGMATWGALLASLAGSFAGQLGTDQRLTDVFAAVFPGYDFATAGGWLQLYAELFFIVAGFAGATFVSKWASDESAGRLEVVLAAPLARVRWVLAGGVAALAAVAVATGLLAIGVGLGAASGGASAGDALAGTASLGLFAAAAVGIGVAVGGLWRPSTAAEVAAIFVVLTFLDQLLAQPLGLPDWVRQLALTAHFGAPMIGRWDAAGVVAALGLAIGGIAVGAAGFARRDVAR